MANPSEVEAQVRFALSQLPVHNAHHEFERICRHLTQQFICSNVLPATGPVSAGGDQGRDFETFRSYLREELGPHGAFLGLVSQGTIAFICTIQADDLLTKLRRDIKKVCSSGHPVHEIRAFTLKSVPVGTRRKLESETQESYEVRLEFHDAESIANLLARPDGFWIAEQFLSIPAEIRPEVADVDGDLPAEYLERRHRWREKGSPNLTLGDFIDLKAGLREATFHQEARGDLPFWLGLVRQLLASPECPTHIRQRARYELVVATLRGTGDFRPVDQVARAYLDESLSEIEPARLQDASSLLFYANTAVRVGLTSLTPTELGDWNRHLTSRIEDLATRETPHRRTSLLFAVGHLGLLPVLSEADILEPTAEGHMLEHWDQVGELSASGGVSLPDDLVLADVSRTLSAWTELVENLEETPLFPIKNLADILQMLVPLWSSQPEWRKLLDLVDEAVGKRLGKTALATRARDRAMMLLQAERHLDAVEELHRAKIDWWSGETVRGSLLAMNAIAGLYLDLQLPQAAKAYALGVAYIADSSGDEELADLVPAGLLMAASADFVAGAWCSAVELFELGLGAQYQLIEDGTDSDKHTGVQNACLQLVYVNACAKLVDSDLAALVGVKTARIDAEGIIEETLNQLNPKDRNYWESFGDTKLVARPFADLGGVRYIRFSALGTDWTLVAANNVDSVRVAERFAAAAQVVLAALAREDLCLVKTRINVRIENREELGTAASEDIESLPSNDGREWVVRLGPIRHPDDANPNDSNIELLKMLTMILREASLLPEADFAESLERAFEKGLGHKLTPGRPYDELAAAFAPDPEPEMQRTQYKAPWDCRDGSFGAHDELRWQDGPGPTYSQERAKQLLQTRYENLAKSLRVTMAMLASSEEFRSTAGALRSKGWLDWHILTGIFNIVMNYRFPSDRFGLFSEETQKAMMQAGFQQESAAAEPVPIGSFTLDAMNQHRQLAMMSLLNHWGLECQQKTPDLPAIERLLTDRYGYWDGDVPHADPLADFEKSGSRGGLVVIQDVPPPQQED